MITAGVDLASKDERTATCTIEWVADKAIVRTPKCGASNEDIIALITSSDKVGIDVPFGWPDDFVRAIEAHRDEHPWPTVKEERLYFRETDMFIIRSKAGHPLSVSASLLAVPAIRAAALFSTMARARMPVQRDGSGTVVEVYPAAALRRWGFPSTKYKKAKRKREREELLDRIRARTGSWLVLEPAVLNACHDSDDALDAVIAALVARAMALGLCEDIPEGESERVRREGWIALPKEGTLDKLA